MLSDWSTVSQPLSSMIVLESQPISIGLRLYPLKEEILKLKIILEKEKEISDSLNMSKQYQEIHIKAAF